MVLFSMRMRKSFKDSFKLLEADVRQANTLRAALVSVFLIWAVEYHFSLRVMSREERIIWREIKSDMHLIVPCFPIEVLIKRRIRASKFPREYDGARLQMRISFSSAAHLFLHLVRWTDCSLAGALGLVRILIYKVYVNGTTTMSTHERKASIREFYGVIFPSLLQLQRGITDMEDKRQKTICRLRYRRRDDDERKQLSEIDIEREEECGICMELNGKIVLPNCSHAICMKCFSDWSTRSESCPFCRDNLKLVKPSDLWIYTDKREVVDTATLSRENTRRLFMYTNKLPLVKPDVLFDHYDFHVSYG